MARLGRILRFTGGVLLLAAGGCATERAGVLLCRGDCSNAVCRRGECFQRCERDRDCPAGYVCVCDAGYSVCSVKSLYCSEPLDNVCIRRE